MVKRVSKKRKYMWKERELTRRESEQKRKGKGKIEEIAKVMQRNQRAKLSEMYRRGQVMLSY